MYVYSGTATITECNIHDNKGGGIYVYSGTATITECNIHDNNATWVRSLAASNCARALSWKFLPSPRWEGSESVCAVLTCRGAASVFSLGQ